MSAATGKLEYLGEFDSKITSFQHDSGYMSGNDQVLIAIDASKEYVKRSGKNCRRSIDMSIDRIVAFIK